MVPSTLASGEAPVPVGRRLLPPEGWTTEAARRAEAEVPKDRRTCRTEPAIARAESDRLTATGLRVGAVAADAGHGIGAPLRRGPSARALLRAVGIPRILEVYPAGVTMVEPRPGGRGRPRRHAEPDRLGRAAEEVPADALRREPSRRSGTMIGAADHPVPQGRGRGRPRGDGLSARFAAARIRAADGAARSIGGRPARRLPGDEARLIGGHRASGERKHHLSDLPPETSPKTPASAIEAAPGRLPPAAPVGTDRRRRRRWSCEQAHRRRKEELGLDRVEGRSWRGLRRHALATMIAMTFLRHRRRAEAGRGKKSRLPAARAEPAGRASRHHRGPGEHAAALATPMPAPPRMERTVHTTREGAKVGLGRIAGGTHDRRRR